MDIKEIQKDGFYLKDHKNNPSDFAYLSLNIALKSYASTYQSFFNDEDGILKFLETPIINESSSYPHDYIINSAETIIHLHHFFELMIKEVLRNENELLATDANDKDVILAKLLKNIPLTDEEQNITQSLVFSKSLQRLCTLIDNNLIDNNSYFSAKIRSF